MAKRFQVSVITTTYNHAPYIAKCLESLVNQQSTFDYEIIVGEDGSTDGTREICQAWAAKYPDKIKLFLRDDQNKIIINGVKTGRKNFIECLQSAQGEFIAFCEGDDYWTSPKKLQKQVDFLQSNPDVSLCSHRTAINYLGVYKNVEDDVETTRPQKVYLDRKLTQKEVVEMLTQNGPSMHTSSLMIRSNSVEFPSFFTKLSVADYFIIVMATQHGKAYVFQEEMSAYNKHVEGLASRFTKNEYTWAKNKIEFNTHLNNYTAKKYAQFYEPRIIKGYQKILKVFMKKKQFLQLFKYSISFIVNYPKAAVRFGKTVFFK